MNVSKLNILTRLNSWKRNVVGAVEGLQKETSALRQSVSELDAARGDAANRDAIVSSMQSLLDRHGAAVANIEVRLAELSHGLADLKHESNVGQGKVEEISGGLIELTTATTRVDELRRQFDDMVIAESALSLRSEDLGTKLDRLDSIVTELKSTLDAVALDLDSGDIVRRAVLDGEVSGQKTSIETQLSELEGRQAAAVDSKLTDLQSQQALALESGLASAQSQQQVALETRTAELQAQLESHVAALLLQQREEFETRLTEALSGLGAERLSALEAELARVDAKAAEVDAAHATLRSEHVELKSAHDALENEARHVFRAMARTYGASGVAIAEAQNLYMFESADGVVIIASQTKEVSFRRGDVAGLVARVASGEISRVYVTVDPPPAGRPKLDRADEIGDLIREMPRLATSVFAGAEEIDLPTDQHQFYQFALSRLRVNPHVTGMLAEVFAEAFGVRPPPFDKIAELPRSVPAEPKRRSVLFVHNSYYHFNALSASLKKRGWDAVTLSLEAKVGPQRQFYHGEDINLHDPDFNVMRENVRSFLQSVPERFGAIHFYGQGCSSLFPEHFDSGAEPTHVPWDFFELRRHRMLIGYMPTGCLDGTRQSDIRRITGGLCSKCVWEREPGVCSDARGMAWAERLDSVCDWIGLEGDWVVGPRTGAKYVRGPVATAVDSDAWRPGIKPPEHMILPRDPDEVLVYHAVGNRDTRSRAGRDIKGTNAVLKAIETLESEGLPVRLIFFTNVASTVIRNYQVQADIVIDQLHYGRYGANARECLMLGRPVIGNIDPRQEDGGEILRMFDECPIVRANTETVTDTLRELVLDKARRKRLGRQSRHYAKKWHSADACAERYEKVIDRLRNGLSPDSLDLYPGEG